MKPPSNEIQNIRDDLFLIVIAGGSGTRFWPKSTSKHPKQFLSFSSTAGSKNESLLAQTVARFQGWVPEKQKWVVTTQLLADAVVAQELGVRVLAEPTGRNTAPCIFWAAQEVAKVNPNGIMLVMPADHYIAEVEKFTEVVKKAAVYAQKSGALVTLGIRPTRPETGYGYLRVKASNTALRGRASSGAEIPPSDDACEVEAFIEKPNLEKANEFIQSGNYLWNGGMFLWSVQAILKAFDQFMPEMKKAWEEAQGKIENAYPKMTATSIDYGIMEKASRVVTFPLECGWDDLGSWPSLEGIAKKIGAVQDGNTVTAGEVFAIEAAHNIVDAPGRLVSLLGVNDLIIVEKGDALLIAHKTRAQDIRKVVDGVKKVRPDLT